MAAVTPLRVAVVGAGYWGKNYVRVCHEVPDIELVYVVDRDENLLADTKRRFPTYKFTREIDDALEGDQVDAVIIATPAVTHHKLACLALDKGKHCIVEKPLATTSAHAQDLVARAEKAGVVLMCGFTALFTPAMQRVAQMFHDDVIGKVYNVVARRLSLGIVRNDVSVTWDLAAHDLAAFTVFMRDVPERVSCAGAKYLNGRFEDAAFITMTYPNGVIAHCHVSWTDPQKQRQTVIISDKMRIAVDDVDVMQPLKITNCTIKSEQLVKGETNDVIDYGEFVHITNAGDSTLPHLAPTEPLKNLCHHFVKCARLKKKCFASGQIGEVVVRLLEAIDVSMANHGTPVKIDRLPSDDSLKDHVWDA